MEAGKPISYPHKLRPVVDWLVDKGFASVTNANQLVILSSCLETTTILEQPEIVELPLNQSSWFGLRKTLTSSGWTPGDGGSASVPNKIYNEKNGQKLYMEFLLTRNSDSLETIRVLVVGGRWFSFARYFTRWWCMHELNLNKLRTRLRNEVWERGSLLPFCEHGGLLQMFLVRSWLQSTGDSWVDWCQLPIIPIC